MDDGAASMEAANEMLRLAAKSGITDIAATLHANLRYAFEPAAVTAAVAELQAAASGALRLHYGCEMHLTPENIERAIREPWLRQMDASRSNIGQRAEVAFLESQNRESMLNKAVAETKSEFDSVNVRSFQYQALKREAEGDKTSTPDFRTVRSGSPTWRVRRSRRYFPTSS
jgi:hypothetical protein